MITYTPKTIGPAIKKDSEARKAAVARGIRNGARYGRAMLVRATPVDQGQAKAAWKTHTTGKATGEIANNHNTAPHIGIIEKGARPHKVSLEGRQALYEWVLRHFQLQGKEVVKRVNRNLSKRQNLKNTEVGVKEAWRIVNAICRKLEIHGQKPTLFVQGLLPELTAVAKAEVEKMVDKIKIEVKV